VFYMGRDSAPEIARQLLDAGRPGATPVALVEACSTPRERVLRLTLAALAAGRAQDWLDSTQPSLVMIGEAFAARAGQDASASSHEEARRSAA
jgi:uroporphyrin-III C-methyltransferase